MIKYVFDASAVLALLFLEKGWEKVDPILSESAISTVNVAEVLTKLIQENISLEKSSQDFFDLNLKLVELTVAQSVKAAELRPLTRHQGLSLGDRCCLALTIQEKARAVTADRNWANPDFCKIEVIR